MIEINEEKEVEYFYQLSKQITSMENGIGKLTKENYKSAIVYGLLMVVAAFFLSVAQSILDARTFIGIDWVAVIDRGAVYALGVLVGLVSLGKNLLTTNKGNVLGIVKVIPETK